MDSHHKKNKSHQRTDVNWFKPINNSLAKLNSVKAHLYNVDLNKEKTTKVEGMLSNRDRPFRRAGSHNDLRPNDMAISGQSQSEPSSPPVYMDPGHQQRSAWGSSTSIPDLVNQLTARLRKRSTSSIKLQMTRMRPKSCRLRSAHGRPPPCPFTIAVKGNSCQLTGRQQLTDRSDNSHDIAYSRFDGGLYYDRDPPTAICGTLDDDTAISPPPPPMCSPDLGKILDSHQEKSDVSGRLSGSDGLPERPRRPMPEPIHLSLPVAEMDSSVDIDTTRLIEDDELYVPLKPHKACDAGQSATTIDHGWEVERSIDSTEDELEAIKSFHHYPGPANDLRVRISSEKLDSSGVEQSGYNTSRSGTPTSPTTKSKKKRHLRAKGKTNTHLRQVVTSLADRRRSDIELLKDSMQSDKTGTDAHVSKSSGVATVSLAYPDEPRPAGKHGTVSSAARKTGEVEQMIQRLQLNLAVNGKGTTEANDTHYTDMSCEPVLLTRMISKRTPNYYDYARKTKLLKNLSPSQAYTEELVTKTIKTLELAGHSVIEQKVVAKIEEPSFQQKMPQDSPKVKHHIRTPRKKKNPGLSLPPKTEEGGSRWGTSAQSRSVKPVSPGREKPSVSWRHSHRRRAGSARAKADSQTGDRCQLRDDTLSQPQRVMSAPVGTRHKNFKTGECQNHRVKVAPVKYQLHNHRVSDTDMRPNFRKGTVIRGNTTTKEKKPVPFQVTEVWTRGKDFEVDTKGAEQCREMQYRLLEKDIPVALDTLRRALLPPTEYARKAPSYRSSTPPSLPSSTSGLLSSPSVWLAAEYEKVRLAEKAVRTATKMLDEQKKEEAQKQAAKPRVKSAPPGSVQRRQ